MIVSIASGKGGTGKTTVATNLAYVASREGVRVTYLDCDVEEPNGAIFLKPEWSEQRPVHSAVPQVDRDKCIGCGQCGEICQYSAILSVNRTILTFPELCHGCGGCWLVCPEGAITEGEREIGQLRIGLAGDVQFAQGLLNIGHAMSPPLIKAVRGSASAADLTIIDCPPGTSCPVIEAIYGSDYVILVTEPTPFGLNDLKLAVETVRTLDIPFGVLLNRADTGDCETQRFCRDQQIPILSEIPDVREIAEAYSKGVLPAKVSPHYYAGFRQMLNSLTQGVLP
jgi:MinD superfamily P-loop ATPase